MTTKKFYVWLRAKDLQKDGGQYSEIFKTFICKGQVRAGELAEKYWRRAYGYSDLSLCSIAISENKW